MGSFAFLTMSSYVLDDKRVADQAILEHSEDSAPIVPQIEGTESDWNTKKRDI